MKMKTKSTKSTSRDQEMTGQFALADLESIDVTDEVGKRIVTMALKYLSNKYQAGSKISGPQEMRLFLRVRLADRRNEHFGCVFLDNRHRVISVEDIFQGTIDGAMVHPRVVVQKSIDYNAAAVILFHNHPSGVAEPSSADRAITRRLKDALALIDVRVLDHWIVSACDQYSLAERGLM